MRAIRVAACVIVLVVLAGAPVPAADTWVEVKSENFTVMTNAGERKARSLAWQFEQVRSAIRVGWPWAQVQLNRPVLVIAAKNEDSMRTLAPRYWETRGGTRPTSVFVSAPDRHYITLRADVEVEDQGMNPYRSAYWSYSGLVLNASFRRPLPLWLTNGLTSILSNTIVQEKEVQFGRPIPWLAETSKNRPRLLLPQFLAVTRESPYYTQGATREQYDAQAWALVHFLIFSPKENLGLKLNQVVSLILDGASSEDAIRQIYGSLDAVDEASRLYVHQNFYGFARFPVAAGVAAEKFPVRTMTGPDAAAELATMHAAMNRPAEARARLAEARAGGPSVRADDAEGLLLEREQKADDAKALYGRAVDGNSSSYYSHYRLGLLKWTTGMDDATATAIDAHLARAATLNPFYAPALLNRGNLQSSRNPEAALGYLAAAIKLEPGEIGPRVSYVRVLLRLGRRDEALLIARDALPFANAQQKAALETMIAGASSPGGAPR